MPRLVQTDSCPHCGEKLGEVRSRICTACGGSLQQRYLKAGCLSTAPILLGLLGLAELLTRVI